MARKTSIRRMSGSRTAAARVPRDLMAEPKPKPDPAFPPMASMLVPDFALPFVPRAAMCPRQGVSLSPTDPRGIGPCFDPAENRPPLPSLSPTEPAPPSCTGIGFLPSSSQTAHNPTWGWGTVPSSLGGGHSSALRSMLGRNQPQAQLQDRQAQQQHPNQKQGPDQDPDQDPGQDLDQDLDQEDQHPDELFAMDLDTDPGMSSGMDLDKDMEMDMDIETDSVDPPVLADIKKAPSPTPPLMRPRARTYLPPHSTMYPQEPSDGVSRKLSAPSLAQGGAFGRKTHSDGCHQLSRATMPPFKSASQLPTGTGEAHPDTPHIPIPPSHRDSLRSHELPWDQFGGILVPSRSHAQDNDRQKDPRAAVGHRRGRSDQTKKLPYLNGACLAEAAHKGWGCSHAGACELHKGVPMPIPIPNPTPQALTHYPKYMGL